MTADELRIGDIVMRKSTRGRRIRGIVREILDWENGVATFVLVEWSNGPSAGQRYASDALVLVERTADTVADVKSRGA